MIAAKAKQSVEVRLAKDDISVTVQFRLRKRLSITVHPDCSVTALAPEGRTLDDVARYLNRRQKWITKQQMHFRQFHPLPTERRYIAGETHMYLGRRYRLRVRRSRQDKVKLIGAFLNIRVPDPKDSSSIEASLNRWYRSHALPIFDNRLSVCLESARSLRLECPDLLVRNMKKRWGSCSKTGRITLNLDLIKVSLYCIDYVLMHELCHLKIHHHGPGFYRLLSRCMPDWERRKERLERVTL